MDANPQDEWELSKENVQPLRQGRKFANLSMALQPNSADQIVKLKEQRQQFELELRTYSGDDPLDVWHRYIQWTEQNFPKGGKGSHLSQILEQCVTRFKDEPQYKNDKRYIDVWLKFAMQCNEPLEIFGFLFNQGIGSKLSMFYEAWAWELEQVGSTKKADHIYTQGLELGAEPVDYLTKKHREFQARVTRRTLTEGATSQEEPMEQQSAGELQRQALGGLKGKGKNALAPVNRAPRPGAQGGIQIGSAAPKQQMGQKFKVFNDENSDPTSTALPPQTGEWTQAPTKAANRENVRDPGVWKNAKVKQKNMPTIEINEVSAHARPGFMVHQDENVEQPLITPRKVNPEINNQVLSAKKPSKNDDPFYHVQHQTLQDPNQKPMYCKSKVYTGTEEFSLEELRAVSWREKRKEKQMKEQEERLSRKQEELKQQQEELEKQKQQLLEERLKIEAMLSKQSPMETSGLSRSVSGSSLPSQPSQDRPSCLKKQSSTGSLTSHNSTDNLGNCTDDLSQRNSTGDLSRQRPPLNQHPTPFMPNHHQQALQPSSNSKVPLKSCLNSSSNLTPSMNHSTTAPSSGIGFSSNLMTNSAPSSGIGFSSNLMTNSATSSGGAFPKHSMSVNPTPDSSILRTSLRGTPRSGGSIVAPSPTVNTKEAIQAVMGMFNRTLDIEKNFGWDAKHTVDDFEAEFAADNGHMASAAPFSIFTEETTTDPKPTPFEIFSDNKQPSQNAPVATAAPFQIFTDSNTNQSHNALAPTAAPFPIFSEQNTNRDSGGIKAEKQKTSPFEIFSDNCDNVKSGANLSGILGGGFKIYDENQAMEQMQQDDKENCLFPAKKKGLQLSGAMGFVAQPDVYELPMPSEESEMTEVVASNIKPVPDTDMEYDFECGDITFMPKFSSTCNFTEAARLASTPFNPGQVAPLPAPPVSTIKSMIPGDQESISNQTSDLTDINHTGSGCTGDNSQQSNSTDNLTQDNSAQNRRSSVFVNKQANLSPIMEQSDEDAKSQGSSLGNSTNHYPSVFTGNSTHQTSHSVVHPNPTNHVTQLSSVAEESTRLSPQMQDFSKPPVTNLEGSLKKAQLEGNANMTMHEIDISKYVAPEMDEKTERLLNMSVVIDSDDPFDEEKNARFLSRLPTPLHSYTNYHIIKHQMPEIKPGKAQALGVNVYNFTCLLGEGAYAKVYKASLMEDSDFDLEESDDKVIKVQTPACPWEFYITTELHERLAQCSSPYDVRPSVMKVDHCYVYKDGSCLVNDMHQYGTILDLMNLHKRVGLKIAEELIILLTIEMLRLTEQMQKVSIIHGDIKPDNFLITNIPDFSEDSSLDELLGNKSQIVKLIDFGRSIDMTFYPAGTTFTTKVSTSGFQCIEMMTDRPWTYQTDLFGIVGSVHVMLFGEYMKVFCEHNEWKTVKICKRYQFAMEVWRSLFHTFLNIGSCEELPDISLFRTKLEDILRLRLSKANYKVAFADYLKKLTMAYFEHQQH